MKNLYSATPVLPLDLNVILFIASGLLFLLAGLLFAFGPKKGKRKKKRSKLPGTVACILALAVLAGGILTTPQTPESFPLSDIPDYSGSPYISINGNQPDFSSEEITTEAYEFYSELDVLGRCGEAEACCGPELMPKPGEDRESISSVTPSGWVQAKYDFVDGTYLYNRCHLIGWQLTAENANEKNLISGTRYLNIEGMLPFENMIADYIKETGNHVMYRVTPIYNENDLLPSGVHMEGYSVEDNGEGILFNVYCYNVQPGVTIDYATGRSCLSGETLPPELYETLPPEQYNGPYILNTESKKVHMPDCGNAENITASNRQEFSGELSALAGDGYSLCGICLKGITMPEAPDTDSPESNTMGESVPSEEENKFILNKSSKKIHLPSCRYAVDMSVSNKEEFTGNDLSSLIENGYTKCGVCLE